MRLLIVDAKNLLSPAILQGLREEGWLMDVVNTFEKGLWIAKTNSYDLAIFANESGEESEAKIHNFFRECPQLFLLVILKNFSWENKIRLLEKGADEVLASSCTFRELTLKIRILLRREKSRKIDQGMIKIDDLLIDIANFRVKRGKEPITLRRKEFD